MRSLVVALLLTLSSVVSAAENANPIVVMETNKGTVKIELWQDKTPITVANFLQYVDSAYYDGLIFHRVIPGFMIQGGGFSEDMVQKSTLAQIKNEATAELRNSRGTLAMARTQVVDSATSQFFINVVDNDFLNHTDETPRGFGYAVFGEVIDGMSIVDEIANVTTGNRGIFQDVPVEPVIILSIKRE